jgi:hypothetical protein
MNYIKINPDGAIAINEGKAGYFSRVYSNLVAVFRFFKT